MGWSKTVAGANGKKQRLCKSCNRDRNARPGKNCTDPHHLKKADTWKKYNRTRWEKDRTYALLAYGGKCACCGFDDLTKKIGNRSYLQIDHINGGGRTQSKSTYKGKLTRWLSKKIRDNGGVPIPGFRVLCAACNAAMVPGETTCEFCKWRGAGTPPRKEELL